MADFSMSLKSLSIEAQRLMFENDIENGDGVMTTSEREKLAKLLSGDEQFPDGYGDVKDELINFARKFDVAATESKLTKERKNDVRSNMSEKDKNAIDTINDYGRLKAIAEGAGNYTKEQRDYARALLNDSSYAREIDLKEQTRQLKEERAALLAENTELKAQIEELKANSSVAENEKAVAQKAMIELDGLTDEKSTIVPKFKGCINQILNSNDTIISAIKDLNKFGESFKNGTISEENFKSSIEIIKEKINRAKEDITSEKEKGKEYLNSLKESSSSDEIAGRMASVVKGALSSLFGSAVSVAGGVAKKAIEN